MPNSFDSIPTALTQRALANNFSLEEKGRREAVLLNRDFYYGKQEGELTLVNDDVECRILNLTKPIIRKRATLLYKKQLQRVFDGPAQSVSFIENVYKENKIDNRLLQCDLLAELTGSCLVYPEQVDVSEDYPSGIKIRLFDSSSVSVIPDDEDQSIPAAVSLIKLVDRLSKTSTENNPQVERLIRQQIWTANSVTTYDGTLLTSTQSNDLGFLPFVNFQGEEVYDQYLGHAPATIVRKLNADINQTLTDLGYMIKMQAATPIALTGYTSGEGIVIHPGRAFSLPNGASATPLELNPKILEVLELIRWLEEKIFETSSVPKVTVIGGEEARSGRELLVRWFPILSLFQEKAVRYEQKELELANMVCRVAGLPLINEVRVNYPEEDLLPLSTSDETLERDIRLNLKTPIDEIMRQNPEFSEVEAEATLLANKDVNDNIFNERTQENTEQETNDVTEEEGNEEEPDEREGSSDSEESQDSE